MPQEHTRAGVSHHGAYLLTHFRCLANPATPKSCVAMDGAIGTGWLIRAKGALLNALQGILQQGGAIRAELG